MTSDWSALFEIRKHIAVIESQIKQLNSAKQIKKS